MKNLNIPLEEFLRPFFDPGEKICLRIFDDRKTGACETIWIFFDFCRGCVVRLDVCIIIDLFPGIIVALT